MIVHYMISGRVQGVGYRAFAKQNAIKLGIKGSVQNLQNGNVECFAEANKEKLEQFEQILKRGPVFGKVDSVINQVMRNKESFTQFKVLY